MKTGLIIIFSLLVFINCFPQNNSKIKKAFGNSGQYVKYSILPVHKTVELVLIKEKTIFDSIVLADKGELQPEKGKEVLSDTEFMRSFPMFDYSFTSKHYLLTNGFLAIDQSVHNLANPYFICKSEEDYKLVTQYLLIYHLDSPLEPVIECSLFSHKLIKQFLEKEKLKLLKEKSIPGRQLFKAKNGRYVYVEYFNKNNPMLKLFKNYYPDLYDDSGTEYYIDLIIYESSEVMKKLGVLETIQREVDEYKNE
jgi:hypothetical protein